MPKSENTNESLNDAKGKLHEVATLYAFSGNVWSNTMHYRSEGEAPFDIFNVCANTLGHDATVRIMDHSYGTFLNIVERLHADEVLAATNAYWDATWTSREDNPGTPGDHERFTGVKDVNSDADIMIRTESGPLGISLKYGSTKNVNLKNPGKPVIEEMLGLDDLDRHRIPHDEWMFELGFQGTAKENHEEWKRDRHTDRGRSAVVSSLEYRRAIAADIRRALHMKRPEEIREFVLTLCANPTVFKHYRSHTRIRKADVDYHVSDVIEHSVRCADRYDNWTVDTSQTGTVVTVRALNRQHDVEEPVATLSIKNQSGPMKSWNGMFTAPMLTERKRPLNVVNVFDLDDTLFWYPEEGSARVHLCCEDGSLIRKLSPHEYAQHRREPGERYNYIEFRDSKLLKATARPIRKIIDRMAKLISEGAIVYVLTARNQLDDWKDLDDLLLEHGLDPDHFMILSAGTLTGPTDSTAKAKRRVFEDLIVRHSADIVRVWDDSTDNLDKFLSLAQDRPGLRLEARLVTHNPKKGTTNVKVIRP